MRILHVVGARPNFMKIALVLREMSDRDSVGNVLLHSGQHYDAGMSDAFLTDLGIRQPDIYLGVGSGSHGKQTAEVLAKTEEVLLAGDWAIDRRMPEELNRTVTDQLSDLCLTPSRDGDENLLAEGIPEERIRFVGNVMIDTLLYTLEEVRRDPPVSRTGAGQVCGGNAPPAVERR